MKISKISISFWITFLAMIALTSQNLYSEESYKVGFIVSATGPASTLGDNEYKTAIMIKEQVNQAGGINGHPFDLIIYDDSSDTTKGVLAVKRLIQNDNVCAIVGSTTSGVSLSIAPFAEEAKIPLVSMAGSIQIVEPVRPYIFKVPGHGSLQLGRACVSFIKPKGIKKIAFIYQAGGYGFEGKASIGDLAKEYGFSIVVEDSYKATDTDMTSILTKVKASDAQALVIYGIPPGTSIVCKNAKQIGLKIPIVLDAGSLNQSFLDLGGEGVEGVFMPAYQVPIINDVPDTDPIKKVIIDYLESFQKRWNKKSDHFGGHAWEALQMVISALREVGPDPKKIRDYIENLKGFKGVTGLFSFSPTKHYGLTKELAYPYMVEVKGGRFVIYKP